MSPNARGAASPRIRGIAVPARLPDSGPVHALCVGEAPGPRGADKSGVPFFGDRAGLPLYRALVAAGACTLPDPVFDGPWDGARFAALGWVPSLRGVALANAFDRCPSNDGVKFRAPTRSELESPTNLDRLGAECAAARARGLRAVLALGAVAARTMQTLAARAPELFTGITILPLPHPSAQGLLSAAPDRGRGARLADLAAAWEATLVTHIRDSRVAAVGNRGTGHGASAPPVEGMAR